ncbi:hypothetical protein MKX03_009495, partial [Papaver bracteatum]
RIWPFGLGIKMPVPDMFMPCSEGSSPGNHFKEKAIGDWYFNRMAIKEIDCPSPSNFTFHHSDILL